MLLPSVLLLLFACKPAPHLIGSEATTPPLEEEVPGADAADVLYNAGVLHEVEIVLGEDDWNALRTETRTYYDLLGEGCMEGPWDSPYNWYPGEVTFDGEPLGTVGIRKKGLIGSLSEERPSFRIDTDRFVPDTWFHGLEKMVLNNNNQDDSRIHTCLAHQWFSTAGLVAPRCSFAHVTVNGVDLGVYDNTESIDEDLVERVLGVVPPTMYEGALSDFRDDWVVTFEPETDTSDGADLQAVTDALTADDDELLERLDAVIDLDAFFTFWAAEALAGHWDGYNGNTNNFYVYSTPEDPRLRFIASGPDATFYSRTPFGREGPIWVLSQSTLSNRLIQHEEGKARYEAEVRRLLVEAWDTDTLLDTVDTWAELLGPVDTRAQRNAIAEVRDVVEHRAADVEEVIGEDVDPHSLMENVCWTEVGTVNITFSATMGSYPNGDVLNAGESTVEYIVEGEEWPSTADGVTAGDYDGDSVIWLAISTIGEDTYLASYVVFDPSLLYDGSELSIDGLDAEGLLLYNAPDTNGQWTTAAYLGNGTLFFETAGAEDGAELVGTLQVNVLGSG